MWSSRHLMGVVGGFASAWALSLALFCVGLLLGHGNALAEEVSASLLGDYGNVTVMEVTGDFAATLPDGTVNSAPREALAKEFYRSHRDNYDFLIIFSNFDIAMPEAGILGFYTPVRNDILGIGLEQFDYSDLYGSAGRLQGTIDMGNLAHHSAEPLSPDFEKTLYTLNHEILHRWSAKVSFLDETGQKSSTMLGFNGTHWSYLLDSDASLLYGSNWNDNGDGTFTAVEVAKSFSPLDLYLMGMVGKNDVPPMTLIENPGIDANGLPQPGVTISGTTRTVTIDDIIAAEGPRIPGVEEAQKSFKAAFIFAVEPGSFTGQALFAIEKIRNAFLTRYSILTDGQGLVQVTADSLPDLPNNPGVSTVSPVPRSLPANIEEGINWLTTHQYEDGRWKDSLQTESRDTAEATRALQLFSADPENVASGTDWLIAASAENTDYLCRKIAALAITGNDVTVQIETLISWQNSDGGWGSLNGYASNSLDTSLALKALGRAGYSNSSVLDKATSYLVDQQFVDGGWGLDGVHGLVQSTAYAIQALKLHAVARDLDITIAAGTAFLQSKQNADGGFGDSVSSIYDSSATLLALSEVGADLGSSRQVAGYLENRQFRDGSWYDSPYQTAMALQALWRSSRDPDLSISSADISFIPEQVSKLPCETVVSVEVANLGRTDVPQAVVRLYEGTVDEQHLLAEQTAAFPGLGNTMLTFPLSLQEGRTYALIVVVDPDSEITELDKGNNQAGRTLTALMTHDFIMAEDSLTLSHSELAQGSDLTISALVRNAGTSDAYNVPLRFYLDDHGQQIEIAVPTVDLPAGEATPVVLNWYANYPGDNLQVIASVDPHGLFTELDENNNQASVALKVVASSLPNLVLAAVPEFAPETALQNGEVLIAVSLLNSGSVAINNVPVSFYLGSPEAGGALLGEVVVAQIAAGESLPVEFLWQAIDVSGEQLIVVRANAAATIAEVDTTDNQTLARLSVLSLPDLVVTAADISVEPSAPREGEAFKVAVNIFNHGDQDATEVRVALELGDETLTKVVPLLTGQDWVALEFKLDSGLSAGDHLLRVIADPDNLQAELNEANNLAEISIGSQNADLWVSEVYFSPNGDGVKDTTRIFCRFSRPQSFAVEVQGEDGQIVRHLGNGLAAAVVDGHELWDGRDDRGAIIADGSYQLRLVSTEGLLLGALQVVVDTNRSSLFDALGTDSLLDAALACDLPKWVPWEWLPAENRLLFGIVKSTISDYETGIYAKDIATGEVQRLLPDDWITANPLTSYTSYEYFLSPDKSRMALTFNKLDVQTQVETSELWLVDTDGANLRHLQSYPRGYAVYDLWWSPAGAKLLVESHNSTEIFDLATGTNYHLDNSSANLIWAPDGSRFLAEGNDLSLVELDGSQRELFAGWADGYWLNDHQIVAVEWGSYEREQYIWLIDVDGGEPPLLLSDDYSHSLVMAADGRSFAFVEGVHSADKLKRVVLVDSFGQKTIIHKTPYLSRDKQFSTYDTTYGAGIISNLLWSPDSQQLAFVDRLAQAISTSTYVPELMVYALADETVTRIPLFACSSFYDYSCQSNDSCWTGCADVDPQPEMGRVRALRYWSGDNQTIVVEGDERLYLLDLNSAEKRELPFSNPGGEFELSFYLDEILYPGQLCGQGEFSLWRFASLLNLTADLRPVRERSAIALYGTAADLNFSSYRLEYADLQQADNWLPIQPAVSSQMVDEYLALWVPPQAGNYQLRLTVTDKAGNRRISRKQVAWSKASLLHNIYRTESIFSPNGDGVKDSTALNFTVAGPVQFTVDVVDADGNILRSLSRSYSQPTTGEVTWGGRDEAGQLVPDGDYTLRLLDFTFVVEVDATLPVADLEFYPDSGTDMKLQGAAADLNLAAMRVERKRIDSQDDWAEYPLSLCSEDADENSLGDAEQSFCREKVLTGGAIGDVVRFYDYRLVAEDLAGNVTIVVAPRVTPDFTLSAWGVPVMLALANSGAAISEPDGGIIPFVRKGDVLIHQAVGFTTMNEAWVEVGMQYWVDGFWHDAVTVPRTELPDALFVFDDPQAGSFSFLWDATPVLDGLPFKVRLKAINAAGEKRFSNEVATENLFSIYPDCRGYSGVVSLFENLRELRHQVVSESTLESIIARMNPSWSLDEVIRRSGEELDSFLASIPEEAWEDYTETHSPDSIPGNVYDRGFGPERYATGYALPLPEYSGDQYLLRLAGVGESGEAYLSPVAAYYPRECPMTLSLHKVPAQGCRVEVPQQISLYIDQLPDTTGLVYNQIEFLVNDGEDERLLEVWQAPFPQAPHPERDGSLMVVGMAQIDLHALPLGENRIIVRLTYLDMSDGSTRTIDDSLNLLVPDLNASGPEITILSPAGGTSLSCRAWQQADGSWLSMPVDGVVSSEHSLAGFDICYTTGVKRADDSGGLLWITSPVDSNFPSPDITGLDFYQGQFSRLDTGTLSQEKAQAIRLVAYDENGQVGFDEISLNSGETILLSQVGSSREVFSPNGDLNKDDVSFYYHLAADLPVTIRVSGPTTDFELMTEALQLQGDHSYSWNGFAPGAGVVPDGYYEVSIKVAGNCGNELIETFSIRVDTMPPGLEFVNPVHDSGILVGKLVEVMATVDERLVSFRLEAGEGALEMVDSWQPVALGTNWPGNNQAGKWQSDNSPGLWTLRLTAADEAGNRGTATLQVELLPRPILFTATSLAPDYLSPDGDGTQDQLSLSSDLLETCLTTLEIINAADEIVYSDTGLAPLSGLQSWSWNGKNPAGVEVADGHYRLRLTAAMAAETSLTQVEELTFIVDTTLPTFAFNSPAPDVHLTDAPTALQGTINDTNLQSYQLQLSDDAGFLLTDSGRSAEVSYELLLNDVLTEGRYTISGFAADLAGNRRELTQTFTLDQTPPQVELLSPIADAGFSGDSAVVSVEGIIAEDNLDSYQLRFARGSEPSVWTTLVSGSELTGRQVVFDWQVGAATTLDDGVYSLSLLVTDLAGNEGEARLQLLLDNTSPVAAIKLPAEGALMIAPFTIAGTATDGNFASALLEWSPGACAEAYQWAPFVRLDDAVENNVITEVPILPADGGYCLRLTVTDLVGNQSVLLRNLTVDTIAPPAPLLSGEVVDNREVKLMWPAVGASDLAAYHLYRDGRQISQPGPAVTSFNELDPLEGTYQYQLQAVDQAGNLSAWSNLFTAVVDRTAPLAGLSAPADSSRKGGLVEIRGTAFSQDDFLQYRISYGAGEAPLAWTLLRSSPVPVSANRLAEWDSWGLPDGFYSLRLEAEDLSGNLAVDTLKIQVDNTPPQVPVLHLPEVRLAEVSLSWEPNRESDLTGYLLFRNGRLVNAAGVVIGSQLPYQLDELAYHDRVPDGTHSYTLVAVDQAGNLSAPSPERIIEVDTRAPQAIIQQPGNGVQFDASLQIVAASVDEDIAGIAFEYAFVGSSEWHELARVETQPYMTTINSAQLGWDYGKILLRAVATDQSGQIDPQPQSIEVEYRDLTAPVAPENVVATSSCATVMLNWDDNQESDLAGYRIYRIDNGPPALLASPQATVSQWSATDVPEGGYLLAMTAVDSSGNESSPPLQVAVGLATPRWTSRDLVTNESQIDLRGEASLSSPATVSLLSDQLVVSEVAVAEDGRFLLRDVELALGENTFRLQATDSQGNTSCLSTELIISRNEVVPDDLSPLPPSLFYPAVPGLDKVVFVGSTKIKGMSEPQVRVQLLAEGLLVAATTTLAVPESRSVVYDFAGYDALLSPQGEYLAYIDDERYDSALVFQALDSGNEIVVAESVYEYLWSGYGRQLIYSYADQNYDDQIAIFNLDSDQSLQVTDDHGAYNDDPSASADGNILAYVSSRDGDYDVWVQNFAANSLTRISEGLDIDTVAVSADGSRVAYYDDDDEILYVVELASGQTFAVDADPYWKGFEWSADSRYLAYLSYSNGNKDVYAYDAVNQTSIQLTDTDAYKYKLHWSPGGSTVIYQLRQNDGNEALYQVSLAGDDSLLVADLLDVSTLQWQSNGEIVYVDDDANLLNYMLPSGFFAFDEVALSPGENQFYAVARDAAGNSSSTSAEIAIIYDTSNLPDVAVLAEDVFVAPAMPSPGELVLANALIRNPGATDLSQLQVDIYLWVSQTELVFLESQIIDQLAAGTGHRLNFSFLAPDTCGLHSVVILADPQELIDELVEGNNFASRDFQVSSESGVQLSLQLNGTSFASQQDLEISLELLNNGRDLDGRLNVQIQDQSGNLVATLAQLDEQFAYGTGSFAYRWNSGEIFAGDYQVRCAIYTRQGELLAEEHQPFTINPDRSLALSLHADQRNYAANTAVLLEVDLRNAGVNDIFSELILKSVIIDSHGQQLLLDEQPVAQLLPGTSSRYLVNWNSAQTAAGNFTVVSEVFADGVVLQSATTDFTIVPASRLTGGLQLEPQTVVYGIELKADYVVSNRGNQAAAGQLKVVLVDPVSLRIAGTSVKDVEIAVNGSVTGESVFLSVDLGLKAYRARLYFIAGDQQQLISEQPFQVIDGVAPELEIKSPLTDESYQQTVSFEVVATDDISGIATVSYRIDGGDWQLMPCADLASGRFALAWDFASEDGGAHSIEFMALDQTGNRSQSGPRHFVVQMDMTPPVTRLEIGSSYFADATGTWYLSADSTLSLTATDDISGVAKTEYRIDTNSWSQYQTPVSLSDLSYGEHTFSFRSTDNLDNREIEQTVTFVLVGVEVESSRLNLPRVLVWIGDKPEPEGSNPGPGYGYGHQRPGHKTDSSRQIVADFLAETFAGQDVYYQIAANEGEYLKAFRSGLFNLTMILDAKLPGGGSFISEFAEAVRRGMGLLYAPGKHAGHSSLQDLLGVKYKGNVSRKYNQLSMQLYDSPVAVAGEVGLLGSVLRTELAGGELAALIPTTSRRPPLRHMTLHLPLDCQPGDLLRVSLLRRHEGQRQIVDEEWLSVNEQDMNEVNQSLGNTAADLRLRGYADAVEMTISTGLSAIAEDYELDVMLQSHLDGESRPVITALKVAHDTRWSVGAMLGKCQVTALNGKSKTSHSDIPGIVLHQYGLGKTAFLAFDLVASVLAEDRPAFVSLVQNVFAYLLPEPAAPVAAALELLQTTVELSASGLDVLASEQLWPGLTYQPLFTHNRANLEYNLTSTGQDQTSYRYFVQTEDRAGTYGKETEVRISAEDMSAAYAAYPFSFVVEKASAQHLQDVMNWLDETLLSYPSGINHDDDDGHDQSCYRGGGRYGRYHHDDSVNPLINLKEQLLKIDLMDKSSARSLDRVIGQVLLALSSFDKLPLDVEEPRAWLNDYLRIMAVKYTWFPERVKNTSDVNDD